jgi:hypothetical protein
MYYFQCLSNNYIKWINKDSKNVHFISSDIKTTLLSYVMCVHEMFVTLKGLTVFHNEEEGSWFLQNKYISVILQSATS